LAALPLGIPGDRQRKLVAGILRLLFVATHPDHGEQSSRTRESNLLIGRALEAWGRLPATRFIEQFGKCMDDARGEREQLRGERQRLKESLSVLGRHNDALRVELAGMIGERDSYRQMLRGGSRPTRRPSKVAVAEAVS
jgi:hypothetical protein